MTILEDIGKKAEQICRHSHEPYEPLKHFDSLDYVDLILWCEDTYGIEITDEEADRLKTLSDYANLVNKKKVICKFPTL